MDVLFVTGNRNKFDEVKLMAEKHGINLLWSDLDVVEHKYDSVKEVSMAKALSAVKILNKPLIVEDTGIFFKDFNNFPGANAKVVFSGIGVDGILKILEGKNREATFVTSFAFIKPGMQPLTFMGECSGKITEKPSKVIDFAYDTIFIPDGDSRTFSEMSKEEKEKYSHRKKAVESFFTWFRETKNI
ncbi:MAG: RdgB/HAM1 family non-canonical purine NTP pyrophosphatase [Nanoarchaeota archaeon]|nr:RdgB/HAM1 family non-canonical purine NTP pyrophosphatase [Nanoarchaeota archaeon]MBU4352687.1 RdgB/HAM1 family non-canonical purine NTP pyrophosphatase [Nanoarchaeota archaeon]MBU4456150.1 RdgB/HAM1 family non-canonical purine NTP pyrophosphatase [Nanoarchaeota archaeon]MCG2719216.1 RdgB/HAM1 family non-canonical purine NTP pyrophosphatase [Nanoarchaeota archaeon]